MYMYIHEKYHIPEEEIDGATSVKLTERMVERLAPTMKKQCQLLEGIEALKKAEVPVPTSPSGGTTPSTAAESDALEPVLSSLSNLGVRKTSRGEWPVLYKLPDFPPAASASLAIKDVQLTSKERSNVKSALITCLFDQITRYTWYVI